MRMKPALRVPHQLLLVFGISLFPGWSVLAQDKITTTDGRTQEVKILGATPTTVQVKVGTGNMTIPAGTVTAIFKAPPPEFVAGVAALDAGDYQKALGLIKPVVDQFNGLKIIWAQQAAALLGDIFVSMEKLPEAEAAYRDLQKSYGGSGSVWANEGLARVAFSKGEYEEAKKKLEPIAAQALTQKHPGPGVARAYSQTFYMLGQICEAHQDYPTALEDYLRTVTLFYADKQAVAAARQKADALRKDHEVTVP